MSYDKTFKQLHRLNAMMGYSASRTMFDYTKAEGQRFASDDLGYYELGGAAAISIMHSDGTPSTYLYYVSHEQKAVEGGTETVVTLKDDKYPVTVKLHYVAYAEENIFKAWTCSSWTTAGLPTALMPATTTEPVWATGTRTTTSCQVVCQR